MKAAILFGHMIKLARTITPFVYEVICQEIDRAVTKDTTLWLLKVIGNT